jgi:hypothetical protein
VPTWDELQDHARKTYTLNRDEESFFGLLWKYDEERSQQITVRRYSMQDQGWIEFRTFVAHEADLNPRVALRKNL